MKIIVLHGDDEHRLYLRLQKFIETAKARSWEVDYLDDPAISIPESLSSTSLFAKERFFILRDVKRLGKKELTWLTKKYGELQGNLIIYNEGYISKTVFSSLPHDITLEEFKLPVIIWSFLEHLYPGNSEKVVVEFHKIIEHEAPEFIFSLISKTFRDLYWVKVSPESMSYQPWRISKLKTQSTKFSQQKLNEIIEQLAEIDVEAKTTKADLVSSLDLFMLKQLE
jgi:DNA polymerase III delta subunit